MHSNEENNLGRSFFKKITKPLKKIVKIANPLSLAKRLAKPTRRILKTVVKINPLYAQVKAARFAKKKFKAMKTQPAEVEEEQQPQYAEPEQEQEQEEEEQEEQEEEEEEETETLDRYLSGVHFMHDEGDSFQEEQLGIEPIAVITAASALAKAFRKKKKQPATPVVVTKKLRRIKSSPFYKQTWFIASAVGVAVLGGVLLLRRN